MADISNADVDFISDIGDTPETPNAEQNGGTRQAGTDDQPTDLRTLLSDAFKEDEAGRLRAPDGKFARKPGEAPAEGEAPQGQAPDPNAPQQPPAGQTQAPDAGAILSALPPEQRPQVEALLGAYENAFQSEMQRFNDYARGYASIEQIIGPRRQAWAMGGMLPEQAVQQLFALSDFAGSDPAQFMLWFANQHGIDVATLGDEYIPPDPTVSRLEQRLNQLEGGFVGQLNQQQQQQQGMLINEVQQFASEKDGTGNPKRPFMAEVSNDMLVMIPHVRAQMPGRSNHDILQEAYDRAVHANPNTRQKLQQANEADRIAAAAKRAGNARLAGSSINGAPADGASMDNGPSGSVRDEIRRAMSMHS